MQQLQYCLSREKQTQSKISLLVITPFCQFTTEQHIHGGFLEVIFIFHVQLLQGKANFTVFIQQMAA